MGTGTEKIPSVSLSILIASSINEPRTFATTLRGNTGHGILASFMGSCKGSDECKLTYVPKDDQETTKKAPYLPFLPPIHDVAWPIFRSTCEYEYIHPSICDHMYLSKKKSELTCFKLIDFLPFLYMSVGASKGKEVYSLRGVQYKSRVCHSRKCSCCGNKKQYHHWYHRWRYW